MRTERIKKDFLNSIVIKKGDYDYFINPISDGFPLVTKELLDEIAQNAEELIDVDFDYILAPEALGIPMATAFTMRTGKPFMILRKRRYDLPDEICIEKDTGYEKSVGMYINFIKKGDRVVLLDDVISTGGTLRSIAQALKDRGAELVMTIIVLDKTDDIEKVSKELGIKIKAMVRVSAKNGKLSIVD